MDIVNTLSTALKQADSGRARSQQKTLGASSVGGCRRQAWHILQGTPKTNHDTENLAAIIGTAIHSTIFEAMKSYDVFGDDFILEENFYDEYFKGNCDFYSKSSQTVYDWKSVTLSKLSKGGLPTKQQKMQVNIYASLISQHYPVKKVGLVFIPRDGKMRDIQVWEDKPSPKLVQEAKDWVKDVQDRTEPPAPERSANFFCAEYCSYFDPTSEIGCPGK